MQLSWIMFNDPRYHRGPCPAPTRKQKKRVLEKIIPEIRKTLAECKDYGPI